MPKKKLIRPWSISTTVRSPQRVRGFLAVLSQLDGREWDGQAQQEFQIRLVQARLYGFGRQQFYNGLTEPDVELLKSGNPISLNDAARIFNAKNYEDPAMRGRNSFKPLQKFGFANIINRRVTITDSGRALLEDDCGYGEILLRSLLKWQLPNPLDASGFPANFGYNIKPFVGILHLMDSVNRLCREREIKEKGLSRTEFEIFGLTLIDWRNISQTADEVVNFRQQLEAMPRNDASDFIDGEANRLRSDFNLKHLLDYADNASRYFRMTGYIAFRGNDRYLDINPLRRVEVNSVIATDSAQPVIFNQKGDYANLLGDVTTPDLPGELPDELRESIADITTRLVSIGETSFSSPSTDATQAELKEQRNTMRERHLTLVEKLGKEQLTEPNNIRQCANELRQLISTRKRRINGPETLERLCKEALEALNDAIEIRANYPVGEDGIPTSNALPGMPDIECYYVGFATICEVTLLRDSKQWVHEGQPVPRHLHVFENREGGTDVENFCIFVAPSMHQDTLNTFHICVRHGYEGRRQNIAPITVEQLCQLLDYCADRREQGTPLVRSEVLKLLTQISQSLADMVTTDAWRDEIPCIIEQWKQDS